MSVIGAATRVAATYYWRCRFKAEIEFGTQRILFREVSKSRGVNCYHLKTPYATHDDQNFRRIKRIQQKRKEAILTWKRDPTRDGGDQNHVPSGRFEMRLMCRKTFFPPAFSTRC